MGTTTINEGTAVTPLTSSLLLGYTEFRKAIGFYMGWDVSGWTTAQGTEITDLMNAGLRQFYWPPPIPVTAKYEGHQPVPETVRWSFLSLKKSITLASGDADYDLPTDFGGDLTSATFSSADALDSLTQITEEHYRQLQSSDAKAGTPTYYAVRPKSTAGDAIQQWEILFYPTPNAIKTVLVRYAVTPPPLTSTNPYPYGGPAHSETILESCLAVAEERKRDASAAHRNRFAALLMASVQHDKTLEDGATVESWPSGDLGATDLNMSYDLLLKRVGHEFGLSWNSKVWPVEERRKVDMVIHQGLRQFYNPIPLPKEKYAHEWSFLRPVTTISTTAPYETGTVTVVSGVVTLLGGTFPAWAATGRFTCGTAVSEAVATRNGNTQITLSDTTFNIAAGSSYSLTPSAAYSLPASFAGIEGPLTYDPSESLLASPIEIVSEFQVRSLLARSTDTGMPRYAAIRPKAITTNTATAYEILFYPTPDDAYVLYYRYRVNMTVLSSTNTYPAGLQPYAETLLESCLAAAERMRDNKEGLHSQRFRELLASAVSADRMASCPQTLGISAEYSDVADVDVYSYPPYRGDYTVTYNGVSY